jgi:hypothetical protein
VVRCGAVRCGVVWCGVVWPGGAGRGGGVTAALSANAMCRKPYPVAGVANEDTAFETMTSHKPPLYFQHEVCIDRSIQ